MGKDMLRGLLEDRVLNQEKMRIEGDENDTEIDQAWPLMNTIIWKKHQASQMLSTTMYQRRLSFQQPRMLSN